MRKSYLILLLLLISACSSGQKHSEKEADQANTSSPSSSEDLKSKIQNSSVDIQYVLGRDHYRFYIASQGNEVIAKTHLGKELLEEGIVDSARYPDFFIKANKFIETCPKQLPTQDSCRNPYVIIIKMGQETKTAHGCRSVDGSAISKLVRDGEFLLYSKK